MLKTISYQDRIKRVSVSVDTKESATKLRKSLKTGQAIGQGMNVAKDLAKLRESYRLKKKKRIKKMN